MTKQSHDNDTKEDTTKAVNIRAVDPQVWHNFKKLAVIHDMTIQDYLTHLVEQEMKRVSISKK